MRPDGPGDARARALAPNGQSMPKESDFTVRVEIELMQSLYDAVLARCTPYFSNVEEAVTTAVCVMVNRPSDGWPMTPMDFVEQLAAMRGVSFEEAMFGRPATPELRRELHDLMNGRG